MPRQGPPILVTGAHRSGSTWVGRMLAAAPGVGYLKEPFNLGHRPGICTVAFPYWFTYVSEANEERYRDALAGALRFEYSVGAELKVVRTPKDVGRLLRDWALMTRNRLRGARPLMKDPIALLSAEWLAERFGMEVVVLVRHPAAFVNSLKRLGWGHDFTHFTGQPLLMEGLLAPFADEIRAHVGHEGDDFVAHAALIWKVLYGAATQLCRRHPEWVLLRHEDLSREPVERFRQLYRRLGLDFTPAVQATIAAHSGGDNPGEVRDGVIHHLHRDSRANVWNWARRLSSAEVETVRAVTAGVAEAYYGAADWQPPEAVLQPASEVVESG